MEKTIIVGNIEFFNTSVLIHSIDEVYLAGTKEEQEVLEDMLDSQNADWIVVQDYRGEIKVHRSCLLVLLGRVTGE